MLTAFFICCVVFLIGLIALDLGVFHRRGHAHIVGMKEALIWTGIWIAIALCFNGAVYLLYGQNWLGWRDAYHTNLSGNEAALLFLQGYVVELSLSMDNLFVFAAILAYFRVPLEHQHRVLVWGILGAIFLRGVMIGLGAALVAQFDWIMYAFGALLIWTAWKMLRSGDSPIDPERNIFVRMARRFFAVTPEFHGSRFFTKINGVRMMTPLFLALLIVDIADVMFAIDSIPAIFGITHDTFIVFTSNMFAVMGLRSMYFALIGLMHRFKYLKPAIVGLLAYIGVKMLLQKVIHIPDEVQLLIIFGFLASGVIVSMIAGGGAEEAKEPVKAQGDIETPVNPEHERSANPQMAQKRQIEFESES